MTPSNTISGMRLSELTARIEGVVKKTFQRQRFWVIADVTNHRYYPNKNHHYFELVDKGENGDEILAKASSVAWKDGHARIEEFQRRTGQRFTNDINVLVAVTVDYHRVYGLKLTLRDISLEYTLGKLQQQKDQVLLRLQTECADFIRKDGDVYVTRNNSLRMRPVIQHVAVVGAANSAGLEDFIHTLDTNEFGYRFTVDRYPCQVQGAGGADTFCRRLVDVFNAQKPYDAVVVLRGGGSQTDFLMFDQFVVGRVVAKFPIPIITGIGHQKDETIADLMAHTPTKAPTKAAEFIIARNRAFEDAVVDLQKRVIIRSQRLLSRQVQDVAGFNTRVVNNARTMLSEQKDEVAQCNRKVVQRAASLIHGHQREIQQVTHKVLSTPRSTVSIRRTELTGITDRLQTGSRSFLKNKRGYLGHYEKVIKLASPESILRRGFAIVKVGDKIIVDQKSIAVGDRIRVVGATGQLTARVETKSHNHEPVTKLRSGLQRA